MSGNSLLRLTERAVTNAEALVIGMADGIDATIDRYATEAFQERERAIVEELRGPARELYRYLVESGALFYGTSAIEIALGREPTFPYRIVSNEPTKTFINVLQKIKRKHGTIFKVDPIGTRRQIKLNLQIVLIVYAECAKWPERQVDGKRIVEPLQSLTNIYYLFSAPTWFKGDWMTAAKIDEQFAPLVQVEEIKPLLDEEGGKICRTNLALLERAGLFKLPVLVSGVQAYNEMMQSDWQAPLTIIAFDIKGVLEFLAGLYGEVASIKQGKMDCLWHSYRVLVRGFHVITVLKMPEPIVYFPSPHWNRTNYHTSALVLLLQGLQEPFYTGLARSLIARASRENLLEPGPFECFQVGYLEGTMEHFMQGR